MSDTIVGALQEYLDQCPLLEGRRLNVDYITRRPLTYMISPSPVDSLVKQYYGGSAIRQYVFVLASCNLYGEDVLTNISNSGFFEKLLGPKTSLSGLMNVYDEISEAATAQGNAIGQHIRKYMPNRATRRKVKVQK